jgi:hypothetical protein
MYYSRNPAGWNWCPSGKASLCHAESFRLPFRFSKKKGSCPFVRHEGARVRELQFQSFSILTRGGVGHLQDSAALPLVKEPLVPTKKASRWTP